MARISGSPDGRDEDREEPSHESGFGADAFDDDPAQSPTEEPVGPTWVVYPVGIVLWMLVGVLILTTIPPEARDSSVGIVLFLLPLGMAVLAAFLNLFTRPERPPTVRAFARTLTFACLWPFVAWGEWDSRRRRNGGGRPG